MTRPPYRHRQPHEGAQPAQRVAREAERVDCPRYRECWLAAARERKVRVPCETCTRAEAQP